MWARNFVHYLLYSCSFLVERRVLPIPPYSLLNTGVSRRYAWKAAQDVGLRPDRPETPYRRGLPR